MNWDTLGTQAVLEKYLQILEFPSTHPDFIPSLIPIFVGLVVLELYFGRYKYEHLGWNSAVSNSTLLITTGLSLIFKLNLMPHTPKSQTIVAWGILGVGTIIMLLNFYHVWPEELAFNVSSSFFSYTMVYITIAVVYTGMEPASTTFVAAGGVLLTFFLLFTGIKHMENTVIPPRMRQGEEQ